jgi:hypothetical protein
MRIIRDPNLLRIVEHDTLIQGLWVQRLRKQPRTVILHRPKERTHGHEPDLLAFASLSSSTPAFASLRSHSGNPESFREFGTIPTWKRWLPLAGDVAHSNESQGFRLSGPFLMRLAQGLLCSMEG